MNLSSHPNNVVLALKLPYVKGVASKELDNYDDSNKV